jgi:hypothetical protein
MLIFVGFVKEEKVEDVQKKPGLSCCQRTCWLIVEVENLELDRLKIFEHNHLLSAL